MNIINKIRNGGPEEAKEALILFLVYFSIFVIIWLVVIWASEMMVGELLWERVLFALVMGYFFACPCFMFGGAGKFLSEFADASLEAVKFNFIPMTFVMGQMLVGMIATPFVLIYAIYKWRS